MATYLDRILDAHRAAAEQDRRDVSELAKQAQKSPVGRGFAKALRRDEAVAVIAEVKRASPLKGPLSLDLDPALLAKSYERGGATALSVLTDSEFFAGSAEDLVSAKAATDLPVLRKDFTVRVADVLDAKLMGADAVLLIAAALCDEELSELLAVANSLDVDAVVEVHDESESERALSAGASLIGVNQRDLTTFEVDPGRALRVGRALPAGVTRIAESGIRSADDVRRLAGAGFSAVLVGEAFVRSGDPEAAVRRLVGIAR